MMNDPEDVRLIWLDNLVHSHAHVSIEKKLQLLTNHLQVFDDAQRCEEYIKSIMSSNQFVLICSNDLSPQLLSKLIQLGQISSIYIHSQDTKSSQQSIDQSAKIKGMLNQMDDLIDHIRQDRFQRMHNMTLEPLAMSIYGTNIKSDQTTTGLNGQFVHSQLLIDCLRRMEPTRTDRDEFIEYCLQKYHTNENELRNIQNFKETYRAQDGLLWYTKNTFLYRLLNQSLRQQDIDRLFQLRFVIRDIEEKLKEYRCTRATVLYRGQMISKKEFEVLQTSIGQLISINSFLSTTLDRQVATLSLQPSKSHSDELQPVLFEIDADPCQQNALPFADISMHSQFPQEREVLMMLGSVFRLNKIFLNDNYQCVIKLTLCGDNDHDLVDIFNYMKNQYDCAHNRLLLFGHVLVDMGSFDEAEKYYTRLVKQLSSKDREASNCYHALGKVACEKGNYDHSLRWFLKSLKITEGKLRENHWKIGFIYTSIGEVYQKSGCIKKALEAYEKALHIWTTNNQEEFVAWCHNNIGMIYDEDKQYNRAIECHLKALETKERILPPQHPCLGNSYLNIGNVYYHLKDYARALQNYEKAKSIYQQSLTPRHPSIACATKNIGIIHEMRREYSQALQQYESAYAIREGRFSLTHPDTVLIQRDIQRVSLKIKSNHSKSNK